MSDISGFLDDDFVLSGEACLSLFLDGDPLRLLRRLPLDGDLEEDRTR